MGSALAVFLPAEVPKLQHPQARAELGVQQRPQCTTRFHLHEVEISAGKKLVLLLTQDLGATLPTDIC